MAITELLEQQVDQRREGKECQFNGYLEDFLNLDQQLDPTTYQAFTKILELNPDVKICVGLRNEVNKTAISNQIIRYKDIFKLEGKAVCYPYILYGNVDGVDRALLFVPNEPYGYLYAKGYYYCLTEPGSEYIDCKNEIVAYASNSVDEIVSVYQQLYTKKAGALQRQLDHAKYEDYEQLKQDAIACANLLKQKAEEEIPTSENKEEKINSYVIRWFLVKKVVYVQYMVNKNLLNDVHEGNIKKQRNQAKINADEISFLSFSQMWRLN